MTDIAGISARQGYLDARGDRRRRLAWGAALVVLAIGAAALSIWVGIPAWPATAILLLVAWLRRPVPDPERWLRGAAGEEATARVLARLPAKRWVVRHDLPVPGSRANIDHLVVGPTGVWCIDTKTTRAPVRAAWRTVRFGDRRLDAGPVRWEAQVAADRLGVPVRPLIVVHGRGLRRRGGRSGGVRVVGPARLLRTIRRGRWRLDEPTITTILEKVEALGG